MLRVSAVARRLATRSIVTLSAPRSLTDPSTRINRRGVLSSSLGASFRCLASSPPSLRQLPCQVYSHSTRAAHTVTAAAERETAPLLVPSATLQAAAPITPQEFAQALTALFSYDSNTSDAGRNNSNSNIPPLIVAAVSGGADSLALALLLHEWAHSCVPLASVRAAVVDHGLRAEASAEAAAVAGFLRSAGLQTDVLAMQWGESVSSINADSATEDDQASRSQTATARSAAPPALPPRPSLKSLQSAARVRRRALLLQHVCALHWPRPPRATPEERAPQVGQHSRTGRRQRQWQWLQRTGAASEQPEDEFGEGLEGEGEARPDRYTTVAAARAERSERLERAEQDAATSHRLLSDDDDRFDSTDAAVAPRAVSATDDDSALLPFIVTPPPPPFAS